MQLIWCERYNMFLRLPEDQQLVERLAREGKVSKNVFLIEDDLINAQELKDSCPTDQKNRLI